METLEMFKNLGAVITGAFAVLGTVASWKALFRQQKKGAVDDAVTNEKRDSHQDGELKVIHTLIVGMTNQLDDIKGSMANSFDKHDVAIRDHSDRISRLEERVNMKEGR